MAEQDPNKARQDPNLELPGDANSADIVGRTGEEMPLQSHDGVESDERERRSRGSDDAHEPVRADDDNPRGRVAD